MAKVWEIEHKFESSKGQLILTRHCYWHRSSFWLWSSRVPRSSVQEFHKDQTLENERYYYSQLPLRRTHSGPALTVHLREVSALEGDEEMTEVLQGPTPRVRFREVSALMRCSLRRSWLYLKDNTIPIWRQLQVKNFNNYLWTNYRIQIMVHAYSFYVFTNLFNIHYSLVQEKKTC